MKTKIIAFKVLLCLCSLTAAAQELPAEKDWTMLVFLNGHSNLDEFGALNINQMESVDTSPWLNIVVQWASMNFEKTTKRMLIQPDADMDKVTSPVVQELPLVDMGDYQQLVEFVNWGIKTYPARHYFVVVWNHGGGWHSPLSFPRVQDISWDDRSEHFITTEQLGGAMRAISEQLGRKIDLYGSDACLMSMIEVASEMQDSVEVFVGSQELEPGEGWPYDAFLRRWDSNAGATAEEIGRMLTETYVDAYLLDPMTTFSTLQLDGLPLLEQKLAAWKEKLINYPNMNVLATVATDSIRFFFDDYVDLASLANTLEVGLSDSGMSAEISDVKSALKNVVYFNLSNSGADGLSVWWPLDREIWKNYERRYSGLKFSKTTGWDELMRKLAPKP
jgi:hypothetical protein